MKAFNIFIALTLCLAYATAQNTASINAGFKTMANTNFILKTAAYNLGEQPANITAGNTDANGNLQINLNLGGGGVPLTLSLGNYDINLFITVGDSVYMTSEGNDFYNGLKFSGIGAEANGFIHASFLKFEKPEMDEAIKISAADKSDPVSGFIKLPHAVKYKTMMQDDFNKYADKLSADKQKFYEEKASKSVSVYFSSWMQAEIKYEPANMKVKYASVHVMMNPVDSKENFTTNYEGTFSSKNLNDSAAILSDQYVHYLENYFALKPSKNNAPLTIKEKMERDYFAKKAELTGLLRDYILARHLYSCQSLFKSDTALNKKLLADYKEFNINKNFLNVLMSAYQPKQTSPGMNTVNAGDKAPDFTVYTSEGKKIALSDFKGKIVYLDIWASWCGPCKREIPFAREMEEKLKGQDIVFLCVSTDRDSSAWHRILREQNPVGIHAIDLDPGNGISRNYGVATIPRYVIIDRNGIILDPNAKRPSGNVADDLIRYNNMK